MADIDIVYSGGAQNSEPEKSLGGFPSPVSVTDEKNNLFDDVTPKETTQGKTEYRCIYVFNDNLNIKFDAKIFIEYLNEIGATVQLGLLLQNGVQSIRFTQVPTSGTFTLSVQGLKSDTITWDSDPPTLADRMQTALQAVTDCTVVVNSPGQHYYNITFKGVLGNKAIATMSVTDNNLEPYGTIFPTVQQVIIGSPINTVAPDTGFESLTPTGIPFNTILAPGVVIGTLYPAEGFPIWVKRIVEPGFEAIEGDGFILHTEATGSLLN